MKSTKELFEEFKDKRFVFYGSYARDDHYSEVEAYSGLVFERGEFYTILEKAPELLPYTEEYFFYELGSKNLEIKGEKFIKEFDSLADYYFWYQTIETLEMDFTHDYMFGNYIEYQEGLAQKYDVELDNDDLSYKYNQFVRTANVLHSLDDWERESVFDYIDKNYEIKTLLR